MTNHLPALDCSLMGPAIALYTIRINGHLAALVLTALPALVAQREDAQTVLTGLLDRSGLCVVLAEIESLGPRPHRGPPAHIATQRTGTRRQRLTLMAAASLAYLRRETFDERRKEGPVMVESRSNPLKRAPGSMTEDPGRAEWLRRARSHLRAADPVLARIIDDRPDFDPRAWLAQLPPMDLYGALLFQVTGQQLSVAATRRTVARIEALFDGHLPAPSELLRVDPARLREAGLSWRKINTLRDLAERLTDGRLDQDVLSGLPDDELMAELTAISGIGPWTVQGALIVALHREDVVLPGDLALRKAVRDAYRLDRLPTEQEVLAIAEKWRPFRSLATSYLFSAAFEDTRAPTVVPRQP